MSTTIEKAARRRLWSALRRAGLKVKYHRITGVIVTLVEAVRA